MTYAYEGGGVLKYLKMCSRNVWMNLSDVPEEDEPPSYESVVTDGLDEGEVDYHKPEETESSSAWARNEQLDRHERGHCIEKEGTFNDITI